MLMKLYSDWHFLTLISIFCWGLWGFLSKVVADKLEWGTVLALLSIGTLIVVLATTPASFVLKMDKSIFIGLLAGVFCALGYLFFYRALLKADASAVIPISSMYIVVAVILAMIFLDEPITVRRIGGILSAVFAIFLLSK